MLCTVLWVSSTLVTSATAADGAKSSDTDRGDRMFAAYFENETRKMSDACLADIQSWDDWTARRDTYRQQLREMLGLDPLPDSTPLRPVVTGKIEHAEFTVEKLHFQSRPHLYVTANLYLPKNQRGPAPAILYVCGHSKSVKDGVSYGNKTKYQHHGAWFARNGYVCLVIDTLQLGEIEGIHHGTYRENMWWWNARGYTPAGVEAWNSIRALDYLESRPEVDKERLGVTGRSGGGAHSWYLAALDDRIKCLVPVAGITNLKNHVVDGCVEGHCDCMYFVNTYRWDYPQLAALSAPRPLLLSNSDQDDIFPLDGVLDMHDRLKNLYALSDKRNDLGLHITFGPHEDTQVLQLHAFQWFNHYFKGDDEPILDLAESYFEPEKLKVFKELPPDQINTRVHEMFTQLAPEPPVPASAAEWKPQRDAWMKTLREKCFAGWPAPEERSPASLNVERVYEATADDLKLTAYDFDSQHDVRLRLYVAQPADPADRGGNSVLFHPLDELGWGYLMGAIQSQFPEQFAEQPHVEFKARELAGIKRIIFATGAVAYVAPRGIGPTVTDPKPLEHVHLKRRFMLLGQTLDGMQVWDVRRAIQALRTIDDLADKPLQIEARRNMAGITLYAALFEPNIASINLVSLKRSHRDGPDFLNVLRYLDVPQSVAMVAEKTKVRIHPEDEKGWDYPIGVANALGWDPIEIENMKAGGK